MGDIVPVEEDLAVGGADQAGEDAEQGALAGSVRPHQTDELAGRTATETSSTASSPP